MRPIEQQTILVTGATDGLGRALACELAARGATVLLHGRSAERLTAAANDVQQAFGGRPKTYLADFSSLEAVRGFAAEIERDHSRLDVLINNAAAGAGPRGAGRELSTDGYELRFAVNYLAPFLLTNLLLPLLRRSTPSRIVNVTSAGQAPIDFADVMLERNYDGMRAYCQSKLALISFTIELAALLTSQGEHGVTVNALHPASMMNTKMVHEYFGYSKSPIDDGLEAILRLIIDAPLVSGRYFDRFDEVRAQQQAYDTSARQQLWRLSEELVGLGKPSART